MARRVPLARRNLLAEPRRLAASVAGVGLALMLILLLDGLWAGLLSQVTLFEDGVGADLYVAQRGTGNLLGDSSVLPLSTLERVRRDPGVRWAAPVRALFTVLAMHDRKVPAYLVGAVPGRRGEPWSLRAGRPPERDDEIAVDGVLADRHGLHLGGFLEVLGQRLRIVGITKGTSTFMTGFVFVTHQASDDLLRLPGTTSFVLVGTRRPGAVARRLRAAGLNVLDRETVKRNDVAVMTRVYGVPLRLMLAVALAAGALVIALAAYTSVSERRREYGIVKALGATGGRLTGLALGQSLGLAALGLLAGALFFLGGRGLITWVRPQFSVVLTQASVLRAVGAAALMGLVAAVVPARRLATLDPASAYRST